MGDVGGVNQVNGFGLTAFAASGKASLETLLARGNGKGGGGEEEAEESGSGDHFDDVDGERELKTAEKELCAEETKVVAKLTAFISHSSVRAHP